MASLVQVVCILIILGVLTTPLIIGRHCCLWCDITYTELQGPRGTRGRSTIRTLDSLQEAHERFVAAGTKLKDAKEFKNVIQERFFDIPINQVGLH